MFEASEFLLCISSYLYAPPHERGMGGRKKYYSSFCLSHQTENRRHGSESTSGSPKSKPGPTSSVLVASSLGSEFGTIRLVRPNTRNSFFVLVFALPPLQVPYHVTYQAPGTTRYLVSHVPGISYCMYVYQVRSMYFVFAHARS